MSSPGSQSPTNSPNVRVALVVGAAIVVALAVWFFLIRDDDASSSSEPAEKGEPTTASVDSLVDLSEKLDAPIYWAGEIEGTEIELTRTRGANVFVRYLTDNAEPGDKQADFLTVGTYPFKDAYGVLEERASEEGQIAEETEDGGLAVASEDNPNSVYLAYPGLDYQIEVYDPDPARALELALTGAVEPVR